MSTERFYALRRKDGEPMHGDGAWVQIDGPDDWSLAEAEVFQTMRDGDYEVLDVSVVVHEVRHIAWQDEDAVDGASCDEPNCPHPAFYQLPGRARIQLCTEHVGWRLVDAVPIETLKHGAAADLGEGLAAIHAVRDRLKPTTKDGDV